ncbi:type VII secretion target [Kineosporia babensis]|uniref:ESX-1 secretion-associated protein n=1 Tax=Kineosporia babensis TaxID=499548 RepID=A0A9X1NKW2_9ACTN|nr:type VII secretion target [Kineosporia babensis]MCD5316043.1 ESX-1 secretion-associated protein [Kineosporia babensis]
MAGKVRVDPDELRKCDKKADLVVEQLAPLNPGDHLAAAAKGIPGQDSVTLLKNVGSLWESQLRSLCERVSRYGESLHTAAREYESSDEAGASGYRTIAPSGLR